MPDDDGEDLVPRSHIRELERQANEAKALQDQLAQLTRENAFVKALGSDYSDPKMSYFVKGYEGELDADAIRAAATEAGFLSTTPSTPPPPTGPGPAETAAHQRLVDASTGAAGNRPIDLIEAFGPRGSKTPEEILALCEAAGIPTSRTVQ